MIHYYDDVPYSVWVDHADNTVNIRNANDDHIATLGSAECEYKREAAHRLVHAYNNCAKLVAFAEAMKRYMLPLELAAMRDSALEAAVGGSYD